MQIEQKVLLLGIFTKEQDESISEVLLKLEETGMFTLKEAKRMLKGLRDFGYLQDSKLTLSGLEKAKEIEKEFKL